MLWKMPLPSLVLQPYNPPLAWKIIACKSSIDKHGQIHPPSSPQVTSTFLMTRILLRVIACWRLRPDFSSNETVRQNQSRNNQRALEKHVSFFYKTLPGDHGTLANPFINPGSLPGWLCWFMSQASNAPCFLIIVSDWVIHFNNICLYMYSLTHHAKVQINLRPDWSTIIFCSLEKNRCDLWTPFVLHE